MVIIGESILSHRKKGEKRVVFLNLPVTKHNSKAFQSLRITAFSLMGIGDTFFGSVLI